MLDPGLQADALERGEGLGFEVQLVGDGVRDAAHDREVYRVFRTLSEH